MRAVEGEAAKYCHNVIPPVYTSKDRKIKIKIKSDASTEHTGYELSYYIFKEGDTLPRFSLLELFAIRRQATCEPYN